MKILPLLLLFATLAASAQTLPGLDPALAADIARIPTIDNHAHPNLPPRPGQPDDRGFDALPVDSMEPQTDPVALSAEFPRLHDAWLALWHLDLQPPLSPDTLVTLQKARSAAQQREGPGYNNWLLTQAGIETQFANRVSMPPGPNPGIATPRFRWVPYADALLYPFSTAALARGTPDRALFFPLEEKLRSQYLHDAGLSAPPPTLAAWLSQVVLPTLQRQRAAGAIAEKFELAYLRDFAIADPTQAEAEAAYLHAASASIPTPADARLLSDFLFRRIALESGRLGMPVHLHTMAGSGSYFDISGVNPLLLEPLFNDRRLRHTNFVLLHGGYPFVHEIGALLQKPNVFLDLSQQGLVFSPRTLAGWLREWLELYPGKVLFGTDGYPYSDGMGWEESTWIASHTTKQALALALSGMLADGELTRAKAHTVAEQVLNGNAHTLYHF